MTPADRAASDPRPELELSPRWVRVRFGGQFVADSRRVLLLREPGRLPIYYFPRADVRAEALAPATHAAPCGREGGAACWTIRVGGRTAEPAAWSYPDPPPGRLPLRDLVSFEWRQMDAWFEEGDEVYVHARDPYRHPDGPARPDRHRDTVPLQGHGGLLRGAERAHPRPGHRVALPPSDPGVRQDREPALLLDERAEAVYVDGAPGAAADPLVAARGGALPGLVTRRMQRTRR